MRCARYLLWPGDEAGIFLIQCAEEGQEGAAQAVQDEAGQEHSPVFRVLLWVELGNQSYRYPAARASAISGVLHMCDRHCILFTVFVLGALFCKVIGISRNAADSNLDIA